MVELKDIRFQYKSNRPLFSGLNLRMESGYIYGLLGKNGAGKTSLLKHLSGLLTPQYGVCLIGGQDIRSRKPQLLEDIFVIPEEFELPAISIAKYVKSNAVFYSKFSQDQLFHYLGEFELSRHEKLSDMSYGQKKKFLIAFGLATNARLLILDEPTNGLDIPSKSQFRKIVASAHSEDRLIIISTHQVRDLENLIDVVVVLENGQIIFNHSIADISENLRFASDIKDAPADEILYSEEMAVRRAGILKNKSGIESRVDLELLFNGIIQNPKAIVTQLTKQSDYVL